MLLAELSAILPAFANAWAYFNPVTLLLTMWCFGAGLAIVFACRNIAHERILITDVDLAHVVLIAWRKVYLQRSAPWAWRMYVLSAVL